MKFTFAFALIFLGLCSASSLYDDSKTNTTVEDLEIQQLETKLYLRTRAVQTLLDDVNNNVQVYSETEDDIGQTVQDNNVIFYGLIHKITHKIKKAVTGVVKKIVDIPKDVVKKIGDEDKSIVGDVTHLKDTIVKQVTDLKNQVKSAVTAVKKLPGEVVGQLKNALDDAKNMARDVLTLHINRVKADIEDIANKLKNELEAAVKAELENAKKILEGDLKAALEAWALAELGPFGAALGQLLEVKQQIENYKNQLLDKLNLAKQLRDKVTAALKNEIDVALKTVRDHYNQFIQQLQGQVDHALQLANQALGGVPAQIAANVEQAIGMVGQTLTQAKARIADLQQQLQTAEGDIKTKVQAEINDFIKTHGDLLRKTKQELQTLQAQIEAKLKTAQGQLNAVLTDLRDRIVARLNEMTAFGKQIGTQI